MPLQTENLAMVGLGVSGDQPPHSIQPVLPDGIHLRWAPDPDRGVPWHGYHLFRRPHDEGRFVCIAPQFDPKWTKGALASATLTLSAGALESDSVLAVTESFAGPTAREFDLRGRKYLRFVLPAGRPARSFRVKIGFFERNAGGGGKEGEAEPDLSIRGGCLGALFGPLRRLKVVSPPPVKVTAYDDGVPVASASIPGGYGGTSTATLSADRMDRLEIQGGPAALIDLCFVPVDQGLAEGWAIIPTFPYPMCLPSAANGYPCEGRPASDALAESLALGRVRYGPASAWAQVPTGGGKTPVSELCSVAGDLTRFGPSGGKMADRTQSYSDTLGDPDNPKMPDQRPLDLILLGAINPAVAQMAGLYWIDDPEPATLTGTATAIANQPAAARAAAAQAANIIAPPPPPPPPPSAPSGAYDYLLLADHNGRFHGDPKQALAALAQPLPADVDAWTCFGLRKQDASPLKAPAEFQVFALPGSATKPSMIALGLVNAAGLRWRIEETADGDLLPGAAIGYHIWRATLGNATPTGPPAETAFSHITTTGMVVVAAPGLAGGLPAASDWPPVPLQKLDAGLAEGWYAYRIRGMDLFGRIGLPSGPSVWRQWAPEPDPRPWYYQGPASNAQVHPFAIRLLDKSPPPAIPGLEAWTLDPLDPALAGETHYDAWHAVGWWNGLSPADKPKRAGLRVRWRWDPEQMAQAPDLKEFRLYFSPGPAPVPGHEDRRAWPQRVYAVDAATHCTAALDANDVPTGGRQYEVLLPEDLAGQSFAGVPLEPTEFDPIVYAHVGVGAADDRLHSPDDPQWPGTGWGNRAGNQGPLVAAKIFRVLRAVPPAPPLVGADDKVWATRADYHDISRYTFRWAKPAAGQKVHIFRTVDDNLFRADWERRRVAGAAAFQMTDVAPFGGDPAVLAELGSPLDAVTTLDWDLTPAVRAAYEKLSEKALRVLASFAGNDDAFVQTTFEPLDPTETANADRIGPDARAPYAPNATLGSCLAEIDGKSANRYFFRAAYVNSAHSVGPLGPSSPAVYCPKVAPPRVPAITRVTSGELAISLEWAHNREPDFAEYRVYRADDERQARDPRLMAAVATIAKAASQASPSKVEWTDTNGLIGGRTYLYCLTAVDDQGNESVSSKAVSAIVVDNRIPEPPEWTEGIWVLRNDLNGSQVAWQGGGSPGFTPALRLAWACRSIDPVFAVTRRTVGDILWTDVPGAIERQGIGQIYTLVVPDAEPIQEMEYQVRVRELTGNWSLPNIALRVEPGPVTP